MYKKLGLLFISTLFSILILEIGLRRFTPHPLYNSFSRIKDNILNRRMNPKLAGIDANGFRNPKVLKQAFLVTLGDSHTYGYNVKSEDSWPYQVGRKINKSVYNFAVGGYGILDYYYLMDKALELHPSFIVLGLYFPNDLGDICQSFKLDYWKQWASERNLESKMEENCLGDNGLIKIIENSPQNETDSIFEKLKTRIIRKTAIGSMFYFELWMPMAIKFNIVDLKKEMRIQDQLNLTVFAYSQIRYYGKCMDLSSSKIKWLVDLTKQLFIEMKKKADSGGARFAVVFIPSKENAYYEYLLKRNYQLPEGYQILVQNERSLVKDFSAFFSEIGINSIDSRPYVAQLIDVRNDVYPIWEDGHPLKVGQEAYSKAVLELLK